MTPWNHTPDIPEEIEEAIKIQLSLKERLSHSDLKVTDIRTIAGADAAYSETKVFAAVVLLSYPDLKIIDQRTEVLPVTFPYVPGLFFFREGPTIIAAVEGLSERPDLLIVNGHGYAHPRRFGAASHIGVILDIPTIGVANRLIRGFKADMGLPYFRGKRVPVMDGEEEVGAVLCTRDGMRPIYVSSGHMTSLSLAEIVVMNTTEGSRLPGPIVYADRLSRVICIRDYKAGASKNNLQTGI